MAGILALLALPAWYYQKKTQVEVAKKQAYETNLPKIRQLLENEKYVAAHALALETEKVIHQDPTLQQYLKDATNTFDIETMPAGARVFYRPYSYVKGPWMELGVTPIKNAVVSVGMNRFRIQMEGYAERELVRAVVPRDSLGYMKFREISDPFQFNLYEKERVPDGTVPVDGGRFRVAIKGVPNKEATVDGPFFIDRVEVTNRAYKEFVDAGGYGDSRYWKEEFKRNGNWSPGPRP
jgi:eukaryotic-like serine/threonine-protein kinase